MRAVMLEVHDEFLEQRRAWGADRWDEMWDGVLHMPPAPNIAQQNFVGKLSIWVDRHWEKAKGRRVFREVNVAAPGGWPKNYRIPDIVLLGAGCPAKDCDEFLEGPPTVAIEIHSPGDEAYEKLPFYAELGVPEVWIIHRDSRSIELYSLQRRDYVEAEPDSNRWMISEAAGIRLRTRRGRKLAIQLAGDPSSLKLLPDK